MRGGRRLAKLTSRVSLGIPHERFFSSLETVASALISLGKTLRARDDDSCGAVAHWTEACVHEGLKESQHTCASSAHPQCHASHLPSLCSLSRVVGQRVGTWCWQPLCESAVPL